MHCIQERREETSSSMVSLLLNLHVNLLYFCFFPYMHCILNRCDRIIWYGNGLKQHEYTRGEVKISDHRPVKAIFTTEVKVLQYSNKIRNLFFSERFEDRIDGYDQIDSKDYSWIST